VIAALEDHINNDWQSSATESTAEQHIESEPVEAEAMEAGNMENFDDGINRTVTLTFTGLNTTDLKIAGDFNDWDPDRGVTTSLSDGTISKTFSVMPGAYQYRLIIDGNWQEDPNSPHRVINEFGETNSVLIVEQEKHALVSA